jgi:hypothetical protein
MGPIATGRADAASHAWTAAKKERPLIGRALRSRSVGAERGTGRLMNAATLVFSLWHSQPMADGIPPMEYDLG